jgi:hypothetical protein
VVILIALVAVAVVVIRVLRPPNLTFAGRPIAAPEATLADGEEILAGIVEERHGATSDDTRCYFSLPSGEGSNVYEFLRCGPVLFVDGDTDEVYLTLPLEDQAEGGGPARLVPADEPEDPEPSGLERGERLRRPDGREPADDPGLEPPLPPRAKSGLFRIESLEGVELDDPGPDAVMVSFSRTYALTGLAAPERFGRGDEARRAAEGEMLLAVELEISPSEEGVADEVPQLGIQIGEAAPRPLPESVGTRVGTVEMVMSVPEDVEVVDLIVTEIDVEQRLSLLTGEPASGNPSVLRRENRSQSLNHSQPLGFTISAPGYLPETFTVTPTILQVDLLWFMGTEGRKHPADPGRAYLVVTGLDLAWPSPPFDPNAALDEPFWTLTAANGATVAAVNVDDQPGFVTIGFEVPADFTAGTISIGGRHTFPDNFTWDFGSNRLDVPISIPAG